MDETKAGARHSHGDMTLGRSIKQKAREIAADMDTLGFTDEPAPIEFDPAAAPEKSIISFGTEVKALGDGRVGGYLVRFSGADAPDLTGDFFTADTDFGPHESTPVIYHHGLDDTLKRRKLADGTLKKDGVGVWVEAQLKLRDEYEREIYKLAEAGKLGWSSGTAAHLVERVAEGKAYRITAWPLGLDASLTPTPAEPRNAAMTLKAYIANLEQVEAPASNDAPEAAVNTDQPIETQRQIKMSDEVKTDNELSDTLKKLAAAVDAIGKDVNALKAEPPIKSGGLAEALEAGKAPAMKTTPKESIADEQLAALKSFLKGELKHTDWDAHNLKVASAEADHIKAYGEWLRGKMSDQAYKATISEGTASLGGNLVPVLYSNQLVGALKEQSILRAAGAYQFPVAGTNSLKVASITRSASATLHAEEALTTAAEPTFGVISFDAYAYRARYVATREALLDSRFPLESVLMDNLGWQFTQAENNQFAIGTGSAQPQGITVGGTMAISGGSTLALAFANGDNIIDLYHALPYQYRSNAVWFANDAVIKTIRKLRWATTSGAGSTTQYLEYLWQPGLAAGQPDTLLGRPIYPLNTMASSGSTGAVLCIADPRFFWISDFQNGGLDFQVLNELYAASAAVGYWGWRRFDSNVVVAEAVQTMKLL